MNTKKITTIGILTALTFALTMLVKIPLPQGYVHLGDAAIFLAAVIAGPIGGAFVGGIGSMLADIAGGYANYAIATLIVKSLMGLIVGFMVDNKTSLVNAKNIMAMFIGGVEMVIGYYIASAFINFNGNFVAPLYTLDTYMSFVQFGVGIVISVIVLASLNKVRNKIL